MKKIRTSDLIGYLLTAVAIFTFQTKFDGVLSFATAVGAIFCFNPLIVGLFYLASSLFSGWARAFCSAVRLAVILVAYYLHKIAKKPPKGILLFVYCIVANVFYLFYRTESNLVLFDKCVFVLCGTAFAFVATYFFRATFVKGISYRPQLDEIVCIALFFVVSAYFLCDVRVGVYRLTEFFAPYVILFCTVCLGDEVGLVSSVLLAMASLLSSGVFDYSMQLVFCAVAVVTLCRINRYVASLTAIAVNMLFGYFFQGGFDVYSLLPVATSAVAFMFTPQSFIVYVSDLAMTKRQYGGRSVVNKIRGELSRKLYQLSEVFGSMKNAFVAMAVGDLTKDEMQKAIVKQVGFDVCADCSKKDYCWNENVTATENCFLALTECAVERGKVTILDVPPTVAVNCERLNSLLSSVNGNALSFVGKRNQASQTNVNRLLVGEQLGGVSKIMQQLAQDCKGKITFNSQKENEIVEQLVFHNVLTDEAIFIEQKSGLSVVLTVAQKDYDEEVVTQVVSSVIKQKVAVERVENTDSDNWLAVYLGIKPRYQVSYGLRTAKKFGSEVSGDTHSFSNIDGNKYLFAVCDGMGSGQSAEKTSDTAIELVENFFRAGFDNQVILSCVNKLLGSFNNEVFTAVDIATVDLQSGLCNFIKLGAPKGVIKTNGVVQFVNGSSLPLGVLDEMRPSISSKVLSSGDLLMICSDGLIDCLGENAVADFVFQTAQTNPQIIADELMEKAMTESGGKPKDDMTVLVARLV